MKALVQERYGEPRDVLTVQEVDAPAPRDGEVLVRVRAASVHIGDVFGVRGVPYLFRPTYGLRRPKVRIPGTDIAGTIEAVGTGATELKPGDEVFGWCTGAFAEFACARGESLVPRPADLSFEHASALGVSAMVALQALRDHGHVQPGQRVLINGASGGVGTFAVQIAKAYGAEVTGVCSTRNLDMVGSIRRRPRHRLHQGGLHQTVTSATTSSSTTSGPVPCRPSGVCSHPVAILLSNGAPVGGWTRPLGRILTVLVSSWFGASRDAPSSRSTAGTTSSP